MNATLVKLTGLEIKITYILEIGLVFQEGKETATYHLTGESYLQYHIRTVFVFCVCEVT